MTVEETILSDRVTMILRARLSLGEHDRARDAAVGAGLTLEEWIGEAITEKLGREELPDYARVIVHLESCSSRRGPYRCCDCLPSPRPA